MTPDVLRAHTRRELAALARDHQVDGWHGMRKAQLIEALIGVGRGLRSESRTNGRRTTGSPRGPNGAATGPQRRPVSRPTGGTDSSPVAPAVPVAPVRRRALVPNACDGSATDSLSVREADPFWLLVSWTLTPAAIRRAAAALGYDWHRAVPVLRMFEVASDDGGMPAQRHLADIDIHGATDHWYVPIEPPARTVRFVLGYRTPGGRFFALLRSNLVKIATSAEGTSGSQPWTQPALRPSRPGEGALSQRAMASLSCLLQAQAASKIDDSLEADDESGAAAAGQFPFQVEVELLVHGAAQRGAQVRVMGKAVDVGPDGGFVLHLPVPSGRLVIPTTALAADGSRRTIIVAIERNTKELEPQAAGDADH